MPKQKRSKRKTNQPAQKRYVSEKRTAKNKARRAARRTRELAKAAAVRPRTEARRNNPPAATPGPQEGQTS